MAFIKWMHVILSYPQPIFHTNPTAHSSTLLFIPSWLTFIPFGPRLRVPIPSLSCHLIPLMEVFLLAQRQVVLHGPANIKFPKEIGARPLMFSGSHRLTHMFFCWCFSVFSLNTILSSSRFPARSPTDHIYSAVCPIYSLSMWNLDFTWNWKSWISHMYIQY